MSKLMDLCFNITDGEHGTVIDDPKGNFFLLSNKNIVNGKVNIDPKLDRRINESTFNKINKRTKIETNDVLISTVGTIGKTSIVEKSVNFAVQRSVGIIKTNHQKLNPYYLKYQLMTSEFQNRLKLLSKGAVQKCLFIEDLKNLEVLCPSIETQNKVAHTLKILEDKISNNNKINAELESLAKTIYDYWFLQFEFPNEEGKPYKSSGGKMVWNEELKREIPEGWNIEQLKNVIKIVDNRGKNPPYTESKSNHPIIDVATLRNEGRAINYNDCSKYVSDETYNSWFRAGHPQLGDILFSTVGSLAETKIFYPTKIEGAIAQNIVGMRTSANLYSYLYQLLNVEKERVIGYKIGSVQPSLKVGHVLSHRFLLPPESVLNEYSKIIENLNLQICSLVEENQELSSLRDFLLPMLMNGQISFR